VKARFAERAAAAAIGLLVDRVAGEPPDAIHPVAAFGRAMGWVERGLYRDERGAGAVYAVTGCTVGYLAGSALPGAVVVAGAAAGRELRRTAVRVRDALHAGEVAHARAIIPALVGRDPNALDASGLSAAVIESLAENTVDAVVAPAWWGAVGGAGSAAAYRALNTMDAMVGHRSSRYEQFGWASARLDDAANFVPARLTALLVAMLRPRAAAAVGRAVREHAPRHPSPNAGVAEAAFAAVLDLELGGPLRYGDRIEERPRLGWGRRPVPGDIDRAVALASHIELALVGLLLATSFLWRSR
jgi:adenosylcobinamide-phosphate synthase